MPGWDRPLAIALRHAVPPNEAASGDMLSPLDDLVAKMRNALATDTSGPEAFAILRLTTAGSL